MEWLITNKFFFGWMMNMSYLAHESVASKWKAGIKNLGGDVVLMKQMWLAVNLVYKRNKLHLKLSKHKNRNLNMTLPQFFIKVKHSGFLNPSINLRRYLTCPLQFAILDPNIYSRDPFLKKYSESILIYREY